MYYDLKKPVEAIQWKPGENEHEVYDFLDDKEQYADFDLTCPYTWLIIRTKPTDQHLITHAFPVAPNDWIIFDPEDVLPLYKLSPEDFEVDVVPAS